MRDGRMARGIVFQRQPRIADDSAVRVLTVGSALLLLALLFGSLA